MAQTSSNDPNSERTTSRVVCLVPSLTETLIECGVNVVGKTRFCIHPSQQVKSIPSVGGTKQARWDRIGELRPDFVVVDKEENPKEFVEDRHFNFLVTHVTSLTTAAQCLRMLSVALDNASLLDVAKRYDEVISGSKSGTVNSTGDQKSSEDLKRKWLLSPPGFISWISEPRSDFRLTQVLYLIWQDPWMTVNQGTFISDTLSNLGGSRLAVKFDHTESRYPEFDLSDFNADETLILASSEPFPFGKKSQRLKDSGFPVALVDGEVYSWFGIRNLKFLESQRKLSNLDASCD